MTCMEIEPQYTLLVVSDYKGTRWPLTTRREQLDVQLDQYMTKTNVYECGKNGQGEKMKINLRYMQKKTQKTIILDKRTAKTKLMKKQHNEKT